MRKVIFSKFTFEDADIEELKEYREKNLKSATLSADEITLTVRCDDNSILNFPDFAPLQHVESDGQITTYYVQSVKQISENAYKITAQSCVARLMAKLHKGGIYTGETAEEIIKDICGELPVIVKTNLKDIRLYGWLPYAAPPNSSARDNLSQVLFALGAYLSVDLNGAIRIENLWDGVASEIGANRIYTGASVTRSSPVSDVAVLEHNYSKFGSEEIELFTGATEEGDIVTFSNPCHTLRAEGFDIIEQRANYAVLSAGNGSLYGIEYVHTTRKIQRHIADVTKNEQIVEAATLVSLANSNGIADKLASYYKCTEIIDADIVAAKEKAGHVVSVINPFTRKPVNACIVSKDDDFSSITKAGCQMLVDFKPEGLQTKTYDAFELIKSNTTWTVPEGVERITVVLIGGGQGGQSGAKGDKGVDRIGGSGTGQGGKKGQGGQGGKILTFTLDVTAGQTFIAKIGTGGAGGQCTTTENTDGTFGTATTFGDYSSDDGASTPQGHVNLINGEVYGLPGGEGISDGGNGDTYDEDGAAVYFPFGWYYDENDERFYTIGDECKSGEPGGWERKNGTNPDGQEWSAVAYGGGGSGCAFAIPGAEGGWGSVDWNNNWGFANGGDGAKGANAKTRFTKKSTDGFGIGGQGGNGGGGGGYGGEAQHTFSSYQWQGSAGEGGLGSQGQRGSNGCVVIYFATAKRNTLSILRDKNGRQILDKYGRRVIV